LMFNLADASIDEPNQINNLEMKLTIAKAQNWMKIFDVGPITLVPTTMKSSPGMTSNGIIDSEYNQVIEELDNELEITREKTDMSNIRSAFSELMVEALTNETEGDSIYSKSIPLKQEVEGWQSNIDLSLGNTGVDLRDLDVGKGKKVTLYFNSKSNALTVDIH